MLLLMDTEVCDCRLLADVQNTQRYCHVSLWLLLMNRPIQIIMMTHIVLFSVKIKPKIDRFGILMKTRKNKIEQLYV